MDFFSGRRKNQTDHINIEKKRRNSVHDVKVMRRADCASDHELLRAKFKISIKVNYTSTTNKRKLYAETLEDTDKLETFRKLK